MNRMLGQRMAALALSPAARPVRFVETGGLAGATQLLLLTVMTHHGVEAVAANAIAFLLAAQLNFALSMGFTWRDRTPTRSLLPCWLLFHGSIALTALLNMGTFALAQTVMPTLLASIAGIIVGAGGNYLTGDRFIFRSSAASTSTQNERTYAT